MKERYYNIDLLKVLSMYMIVILHVLGRGGILNGTPFFTKRYIILWLIEIFCFTSVNFYGMITGYLMINKKIKYSSLFKLWVEVVFWLIIISLILYCFGSVNFIKKDILMFLFPVFNGMYWYFSAYFCLFIFLPFINKFIRSLEQKDYKLLLVLIIVLFGVIGVNKNPFSIDSGYSFVWLFCLYLFGAYFKIYEVKFNKKYYLLLPLLFIIPLVFKILVISFPGVLNYLFKDSMFISYNSIFILIASILLFSFFVNLKINNKYVIRVSKRLSKATFGVYIIHLQPYIWNYLNNRFSYLCDYSFINLIIRIFGWSFLIFIICSYLEMIRIFIFKKLGINVLINSIYNFLHKVYLRIVSNDK